jgi:hypothetical protein
VRIPLSAVVGLLAAAAGAQAPAPTAALRPGSWSYAATATGSQALFTDAAGTQQLALRCLRASRTITISMRSIPTSAMTVLATDASRSLPATYDQASSTATAQLPPRDNLLDALAFSRGRFSVAVVGLSPLVVPAWPEPARAIEDCRN